MRAEIPYLIQKYDYEFNFNATFILIQNALHGGVGLWNVFEQMPHAYLHLVGGIYSPDHIIAAFTLIVLGKAFQLEQPDTYFWLFNVVFYSLHHIERAVLGYLLLKEFTASRATQFWALFVLNTLLSSHMVMGFGLVFLYVLFFLIIYLIYKLFKQVTAERLAALIIGMAIAGNASPLFSLSYFYLALHCFFFSCLVVLFATDGIAGIVLRGRELAAAIKGRPLAIAGALLLGLLIVSPSLLMLANNWGDYQFGVETSRFQKPFSIKEYFRRPVFFGPQSELIPNALNPLHTDWGYSWIFLGGVAVYLSLAGAILSSRRERWIFIVLVALFVMMNSPRRSYDPNLLFHLFHYLTSPLSFIPRTFHMTGAMLLPYALLPLCVLGFDEIRRLAGSTISATDREKVRIWLTIAFAFSALSYLGNLPEYSLAAYIGLLAMLLGVSGFLLLGRATWRHRSAAVLACFAIMLVSDLWGLRQYFQGFLKEVSMLETKENGTALKFGLAEISVPQASPFDLSWPTRIVSMKPVSHDDKYAMNGQAMSRGLVTEYLFWGRLYETGSQYLPTHASYAPLAGDQAALDVLSRDKSLFRFLPAGDLTRAKISDLNSVEADVNYGQVDGWTVNVTMPEAGTLVQLIPFDRKFEILVDGMPQAPIPVFKSFLGVQLAPGSHVVETRYWPHSPLRYAIIVSSILMIASLFMLIRYAIKGIPASAAP